MIVASDSTTLIILADAQKLAYATNIFEKILLPKAVFDEVNYKNTCNFPENFEVVEVKLGDEFDVLLQLLDTGESHAIALAKQRNLPLIIDEKKGRKIAKNLGIHVLGLLGVVYLNIQKGFLSKKEAEDFLETAKKNGYRISETLINDMFASLYM